MPDSFVKEYIGHRVSFVLVHEAGQWNGKLLDVGDQWIKVLVGKGKTTFLPIANIRSMAVEDESGGEHGATR